MLLLMLYGLLRTSSETNRLLLHDSCAKELARVISGLYQDNYRKFEAHVLTSGMKPNYQQYFGPLFVLCIILSGTKGRGQGTVGPLSAPLVHT